MIQDLRRNLIRHLSVCIVVAAGLVTAVLCIATLSTVQREIEKLLVGFGPRSIMFIGGKDSAENQMAWRYDDFQVLKSRFQPRAALGTYSLQNGTLTIGKRSHETKIYAVDENMFVVDSRSTQIGSSFDASAQGELVCVVGATVAASLFPDQDPIGNNVELESRLFRVIGVFSERGLTGNGLDRDNIVWIPFLTGSRRLGFSDSIRVVRALHDPAERSPTDLANEIRTALAELGPQTNEIEAIRLLFPEEAARARKRATRTIRVVSSVTAIGSLAIALGFGVLLNLQIVRSRRREYGLRLALGATAADLLGSLRREVLAVALAGGAVAFAAVIILRRLETVTIADLKIASDQLPYELGILAIGVSLAYGFAISMFARLEFKRIQAQGLLVAD